MLWGEMTLFQTAASHRKAQSAAMIVNGSLRTGLRHKVYRFVVNGSAPELFPVMSFVKKWFTRRKSENVIPI